MDIILTITFWVIQAALVGLGIYVSLKPQPREKHWLFIFIFLVLAVAGLATNIWQSHRASASESARNASINDLRGRLNVMMDMALHPPNNPQLGEILSRLTETPRKGAERISASSKIPIPIPRTVAESTRFLTNDELRQKVAQISRSMRDFENDAKQKGYALDLQPTVPGNGETQEAAWRSRVNKELTLSLNEQTEFRNRYLSEAVTYRDEMLRRLSEMPPEREQYVIALQGRLAGPTPISDLADYLEWLSKRLQQ